MFSRRTRIVGLGFCALWVLFVTGHFRPFDHSVAARTADELPRATVPQHLPWMPGRTVRVIQGNGGSFSHHSDRNRYAWDFALRSGEPVYSGFAGVVHFVLGGCPLDRSDPHCNDDYGNTVTVRAADGTCARFAHLSTLGVYPGMAVAAGTMIGTAGSTGHSTGPHLHYQREDCESRRSVPSSFIEAGVPQAGGRVTSALRG